MIREDVHIGDRLYSWNSGRQGRVVSHAADDGVFPVDDEGEQFQEPYYALMEPPAKPANKVSEG